MNRKELKEAAFNKERIFSRFHMRIPHNRMHAAFFPDAKEKRLLEMEAVNPGQAVQQNLFLPRIYITGNMEELEKLSGCV